MSTKKDEYITFSVRLPKRKVAQLDLLKYLSHESSRNGILGLSIEILENVAQGLTLDEVKRFAKPKDAEAVDRIRQGFIEMLDSMKEAERLRKK